MPFTLTDLQRLIRDTYDAKDRRRGVEGTFMWFMEEVGELAAALRGGIREEQAAEFADVLAWLATLANIAGVDLEAAVQRQVRRRLPRLPARCRALAIRPRNPRMIGGQRFGLVSLETRGPWMRWGRVLLLAVSITSAAASRGAEDVPLQITSVQVGFAAAGKNEPPRFKLGLWTPITVGLQAGAAIDGAVLAVETTDSENVGTVFTVKLPKLNEGAKQTVVTYSRPGNSEGRFAITIRDAKGAVPASTTINQTPLDLRESLFVTIGASLTELDDALLELRRARPDTGQVQDRSDSWPRRAGTSPLRTSSPSARSAMMPSICLSGAQAIPKINRRLLENEAALSAIAGWVRQGGRLVVSVSPSQQKAAASLLEAGRSWQPPLPVAPPPAPVGFTERSLPRLIKVEEWAGITDKPFPAFGEKPVPVSWLLPAKVLRPDLRVLAETPEGRPLIAQMSYGRGQVTLLAFDIDREPFLSWDGRVSFLKAIAGRLEPRIPQVLSEQGGGSNQPTARDLATQLQTTLDLFDVPTFKFGWVALLILGYILLVGPVDYFFLGRVLKRLEWTWISFPLVVLAVSVLIFATIYNIKGEELRINQVDLVDFDLRTELDEKQRPVRAHAYGNTWFTLLSPTIKSYTIGVQPNLIPAWFSGEPKATGPRERRGDDVVGPAGIRRRRRHGPPPRPDFRHATAL